MVGMHIRTLRLCLRPIALGDAAALFAARGDAEVMRYWDWPAQSSVEEVEQVFRDHLPGLDHGRTLWWAVAESGDGAAIGECDLSEIDSRSARAELGFLFAKAYWHKGYAQEAARAAIDHAFGPLGLERLSARCHAGNEASIRLLGRLGFEREGVLKSYVVRDGERRDCLLFGLLKQIRQRG